MGLSPSGNKKKNGDLGVHLVDEACFPERRCNMLVACWATRLGESAARLERRSRSTEAQETMPRRALPVALLSSSPCHLRCLAVVTAAWGANSLRPTAVFPHRHLIGTGTASTGRRAPVFCGAFSLNRRAAHQVADFSTGRRSLGGGSEIACSVGTDAPAGDPGEGAASSTVVVAEPGNAAIEVEERPWLGNGPDPMAKTGRVRPGTAASLAVGEHASAGEGTTGRVWLGNGLDPLASLGEAAVVNGSEKGKGVPFEEMWLNGPFKAPLPAEPLVRTCRAQGSGTV